jgi:hypothetical protein
VDSITAFSISEGTPLTEFADDFLSSGGPIDAAHKSGELTSTKSAVAFKYDSGRLMIVNTEYAPFRPGLSLSHMAMEYKDTTDFVITTGAEFRGQTLDEVIAEKTNDGNNPMYGPYGEGLMDVLATIGWKTVLTE